MDYMAIVSFGAYPTSTATATQRAAFGVSFGLLSLVPAGSGIVATTRGLIRMGFGLSLS